MSAISVFHVKFNVEFTRQAVKFFLNRKAKANKSLGETKRFVFLCAKPVRKQWKPFQSQVSRSIANRKLDIFRMKTTFISNSAVPHIYNL